MKVFKCYNCMYCCFFRSPSEAPVVFPWEKRKLEELADNMGLEKLEFKPIELWLDSKGTCVVTLYRWIIKGFCPFYDIFAKRCRIHDIKPLACRMYPLLVEVPSGKLMISAKCLWVKSNQWVFKLKDVDAITNVFPTELSAAISVLREYSYMLQALEEAKLRKAPSEEDCIEAVDVDAYLVGGNE